MNPILFQESIFFKKIDVSNCFTEYYFYKSLVAKNLHPNTLAQKLNVYYLLYTFFKKEFFISYKENGKPFIEDISKYIGVSHSKTYCAVVISDKNCAVDIQDFDIKAIRVKSKFCNANDVYLPNCEELIQYSLNWSIKETVFKYFSPIFLFFKNDITIKEFMLAQQQALVEVNTPLLQERVWVTYSLELEKAVLTYL